MFTTSVSRIALQHLTSSERMPRIVRETLLRVGFASPVSVSALSGEDHDGSDSLTPTPLVSPRSAINADARCPSSKTSLIPPERKDRFRSQAFCPRGVQFAP
jgi:hypothetical protein